MTPSKRPPTNSSAEGATAPTKICIDIPHALSNDGTYAIWKPGGPGRMLGQLAREHATGEATLTAEELADLVELFRDEPLPDSLRHAIVRHLRGKRLRRQGTPRKRQSAREQVELIMLPGLYDEALKDAKAEREDMRRTGCKQGRYDDLDRLPAASALALQKVREWLPTLTDLDDRRLRNVISEIRARLKDDEAEPPRAPSPSSDQGTD